MIAAMIPSALDPQGPQGELLARLIWLFTAVASAIWVAVVLALAFALWRRRATTPDNPLAIEASGERRSLLITGALVILTGCIVLALTGLSYAVQKHLLGRPPSPLVIRITAHQWWWELEYQDPSPDRTFTTANEIHVPVGETVTFRLRADDVIHSFWVPSLMGKEDLIPGRENTIQFTVARPGVYRGQCAEYCGAQHAHMAIFVVAQDRAAFEAWRNHQIVPASDPTEPERKKGREVFTSKACVMCHQIRGTTASASVGPDLTHLAGRLTIAAGTLPLSRGALAAWIADPQGVKPGTEMPFVRLEPDELIAVTAYLEGLK